MKILKNKKIIFLGCTVFFYLVISFLNPGLGMAGLNNFVVILLKVLPLLVVVFVIMIFTNYFISDEIIKRKFGSSSGKSATIFAVIFGIIVSGPPYILYPLLRDFKDKGATNYILAVFLYNRNIKIPFIPVMIYYFGLSYTIVISVYIILFSVLNGVMVHYFTNMNVVGKVKNS